MHMSLINLYNQATVRLNAVLADNAKLRIDIESHLKERDKFLLQVRYFTRISIVQKRISTEKDSMPH